jgi:uncharacterized SAM-binding protein YcdF (DUF218 family)
MADETPPRPDAIVVLGCRLLEGGRPGGAVLRRAARAAALFSELRPACVVVSGGRSWHGVREADALSAVLRDHGVPTRAIVRELRSLSTVENAYYSCELLRAGGFVRPALVTCDFHLERALACFAAFGMPASGIPAESPPVTSGRRLVRRLAERARAFGTNRRARRWAST